MLVDVFFFGFPLAFVIALSLHAYTKDDGRFWRPAVCFLAYCAFYLVGGREVILYFLSGLIFGGSWLL